LEEYRKQTEKGNLPALEAKKGVVVRDAEKIFE